MITVDTISRHEFIGLETKIINSSQSSSNRIKWNNH